MVECGNKFLKLGIGLGGNGLDREEKDDEDDVCENQRRWVKDKVRDLTRDLTNFGFNPLRDVKDAAWSLLSAATDALKGARALVEPAGTRTSESEDKAGVSELEMAIRQYLEGIMAGNSAETWIDEFSSRFVREFASDELDLKMRSSLNSQKNRIMTACIDWWIEKCVEEKADESNMNSFDVDSMAKCMRTEFNAAYEEHREADIQKNLHAVRLKKEEDLIKNRELKAAEMKDHSKCKDIERAKKSEVKKKERKARKNQGGKVAGPGKSGPKR